MPRFSRDPLEKIITLRVTTEQDRHLGELAEVLDLGGKADVLRHALDYWLENAPEVQEAVKKKPGPKDCG
jgi:hypothetical protein